MLPTVQCIILVTCSYLQTELPSQADEEGQQNPGRTDEIYICDLFRKRQ